ncbi:MULTISPECIES: glycosyltransferase [Bizionia]|uniref:Colanic acid biosynthesis glycosyltransferase WcaL n=1 Tax=Bizionia algoritergicola TaxID=291187 RepID=A0A5D0QSF2_9FLAO|nr:MULTISPECIES: glycosyltransferase [Bizionia]OBX23248.1 hypothetical protein BAA08_05495 [Bizionia sp. APA-3]TYB71621.1 colanic acid biosynthesis glycosyltransferase WcaL [Bizionia algoritergicola]
MKTVCFVVPSFPTFSETFVTSQVLHTKAHGFAVVILTKKLLSSSASSQEELLTRHNIFDQTYKVDFKIPRSKIKRRVKAFFLIFKYLKFWLRVNNIPVRERFSTLPFQLNYYNQFKDISVFHIQFALAGLEVAQMKSIGLLQGRIITTFHGYDAHFQNLEVFNTMQRQYKGLLEASCYITVNTPYLAEKVKLLGADLKKIRLIPMGIDLEFFQAKVEKSLPTNSPIHLISVGRLIELKGFEYAIKTIKLLIDQGYRVTYTIVGGGHEKDNLLGLVAALDLKDSVFLVGVKNQKEIKDLLDEHHIFLMSSITDTTNRAEAQGVVTAEAQAMGLPVVAFNSGGVPYTLSDNKTGFLIEEKNIEDYAAAILKLVNNPSLYNTMSAAAKDFAATSFSRDILSAKFFELYN